MKLRGFGKAILAIAVVAGVNCAALAGPVDQFTDNQSTITASGGGSASSTVPSGSPSANILGGYRAATVTNTGSGTSTTWGVGSSQGNWTVGTGSTAGTLELKYGSLAGGTPFALAPTSIKLNFVPGTFSLTGSVATLAASLSLSGATALTTFTVTGSLGSFTGSLLTSAEVLALGGSANISSLSFSLSSFVGTVNFSSITSADFNFSISNGGGTTPTEGFSILGGTGGFTNTNSPPTPEPATLATFGLLTLVGGVVARRKLKAAPVA